MNLVYTAILFQILKLLVDDSNVEQIIDSVGTIVIFAQIVTIVSPFIKDLINVIGDFYG